MAQVKTVFYIPVKDNDGRDLAMEIADLEMELYLRFVGWTSPGYFKGTYRMPDGTQALDINQAYTIVTDDSRIPELEQVLLSFQAKTQQDSLYLEIQRDIEVRFLK